MSDKPNNKQIEIMSVSHLKLVLARISKLIPDINENDRTPSWDGCIEVYNHDSTKKEYLDGIVPIQVKGKFSDDVTFNSTKYSIEVNDLENYQNNGGVVFFVILCNYTDFRIFYISLLPFDIDLLLKDKMTQNTISVELTMLPNNEREVYLILKDFLYHSKRQMQRDKHIQEMFLSGELANLKPDFSFGYGTRPYPDEEDTKEYILTHPTYIYAKPRGYNIDVVLHKVFMEALTEEIPTPVIVDGQILYDSVMRQTLPHKKHVLKIGNNISIALDDLKFNLKMAPDIKTRIKDLKIVTTMMQGKAILKGYGPILKVSNDELEMYDQLNEHLNYLLDVQKVMDLFSVQKNLDLENMNNEDDRKLDALVRMVLYNEPTTYSCNGNAGIGVLKISNIKLIILCKRSNIDGYFTISNIFSENNIVVKTTLDNGDEISISPYIWFLKYEELITVDNINLDRVIESIQSFERSEAYDAAVNKFALDLISAYDTTNNIDFLNAADTLLSFILLDEIDTEVNAIYKINKAQIKKRKTGLLKEDKIELMRFKSLYTSNTLLIICVDVLLESYEEAGMLYDKLSSEEKEIFDKFPISSLWIKDNE